MKNTEIGSEKLRKIRNSLRYLQAHGCLLPRELLGEILRRRKILGVRFGKPRATKKRSTSCFSQAVEKAMGALPQTPFRETF